MIKNALFCAVMAAITLAIPTYAQTTAPGTQPAQTAPATEPQKAKPDAALIPSDKISVTHHEIKLAQGVLHYTATAGYMPLKDETGKLRANFFFVAYTKDEAAGKSTTTKPVGPATEPLGSVVTTPSHISPARPITFIFNGGPGAASVWLHLGAVGPQRIALADDGTPLPPPTKLVDNTSTWLDTTDLVFIDPVGTGYSRAATPESAKEFYNVGEDIQSVGEFIRLYTTKYDRWGSPKFLAGESYGTTRAALLSDHLAERVGINLNGVILISSVLSFQNISPSESNETAFALYLPTYTAAAFYHKKLSADLQTDLTATLQQAQEFATGPYMTALTKGDKLDPKDRAQMIQQVARYTGLSPDYVDRSNLRIEPSRFEKELLRSQRQVIGRFDARISGPSVDAVGESAEFDPSFSSYYGVYASAFNQYVRQGLNYENDLPYEVIKGIPFSFNESGHGYLYVGDNLRAAMLKNPHLKLMVAAGYYDLATPFASVDYTIEHLQLPAAIRANVTQTYYPGGHMLYHVKANLEKLHSDVATFIAGAVPNK